MQGLVTKYTLAALVCVTSACRPLKPHRVAGQLLGEQGPIAGTVHLRIEGELTGPDLVVGPDGRFDFGKVPNGHYDLVATGPGIASRVVEVDATSVDATNVSIYAFACSRVASTVKSSRGVPIAGARVMLGGVLLATTNAKGVYEVCLNRESVVLDVTAPGFSAHEYCQRGRPPDITLVFTAEEHSEHEPAPYHRLGPFRGGVRISGTVTHEGKPLVDARVFAKILSHDLAVAYTKPDGSYELDVPRSGVIAQIETATGLTATRTVTLPDTGLPPRIDFDIGSTGHVEGTVVAPDGHPPANVQVWLESRDNHDGGYAYTGSDGRFAMEVEIGHTYDLVARPGDSNTDPSRVITLDAEDPEAKDLKLQLLPSRAIEGVVLDDAGAAVAGAQLVVSEPDFERLPDGRSTLKVPWFPSGYKVAGDRAVIGSSMWARETVTDAMGHFTWSPIGPEPYAVLVRKPDGRVGAADAMTFAQSPARIVVHAPGSVHVACKNASPIGESGVDVVSGMRRFIVSCGDTLHELPAGRYLVTMKVADASYASAQVDVTSGSTTEAVLVARPSSKIHGTVVLDPPAPGAAVECEAGPQRSDMLATWDPRVKAASDGSFDITISQGPVRVRCFDMSNAHAVGEADLQLERDATIVVKLGPRSHL